MARGAANMARGAAKVALFDAFASVAQALGSDRVGDLWAAVRDAAVRHVAEVNQLADAYLGERDGVEQVSATELQARLARGDVVVLDVRPEPEYNAGHIPGAQ